MSYSVAQISYFYIIVMTHGYDIKKNAATSHVNVSHVTHGKAVKKYNNVAMSHGYNVNKNMHDSYSHI